MRRRRLILLALAPLGLILLLVLAAAFWRASVVEAVMRDRLAALGVSPVRFSVAEVGLSRLAVEDIALGPADELTVMRAEVDYDLLSGTLEAVRIEQPVLRLDLESGGPPLGALQPLLEGDGEPGGESGAPPALPEIAVADGRIEAATPLGPATLGLDGTAAMTDAGGLDGDFGIDAEAGPARLAGGLKLVMAPDGALDATLAIDQGTIALSAEQAGVAAEIGGLTGSVEATLRDGVPQRVAGSLALTGLGLDQARFREAALDFALEGERLEASGTLRSEDDGLRAAFRGEVADLFGAPSLSVGLSAAASARAALFQPMDLPVDRGTGTLALSLRGRLPELARFGSLAPEGSAAEQAFAWAFGGDVAGRFETHLEGLAVPGRLDGLAADLAGRLLLADGAAALTFDPGAAGSLATADRAWLEELGLPPGLARTAEAGLTFALGPAEPLPAAVTLRPVPAAWELVLDGRLAAHPAETETPAVEVALRQGQVTLGAGLTFLDLPDLALSARDLRLAGVPVTTLSVEGSAFGQPDELETGVVLDARIERLRPSDLDLGGLTLGGVALELPLNLSLLGGAFEAAADGAGRLTVASLSHPSGLSLAKPLSLTLSDGTLLSSPPGVEGTGGGGLTHDLRLSASTVALSLAHDGGGAEPIELRPGRLRVIGQRPNGGRYRGRVTLSGGHLALPALGTALQDLALRLDFDQSFRAPKATFSTKLSYQSLPALALEGKARRDGSTITFDAAAGASEQQLALQGARPSLTGRYDIDSGRASFTLSSLRLGFAPGRLQPADLVPQLADLQNVTGTAALQAAGTWDNGRLGGRGRLVLENLSFTRDDVQVAGLTLDLTLNSLWPPSSPAGQRLVVQRIDAAVPVEGLDAVFHILPGEPAQAGIERLSFGLAGGRYQIRNARIDPAAARQEVTLDVIEMDLAQLFGLLDVEGLTGAGKLSGKLPVTFVGDSVVIKDGRLESAAPGLLSYRRASRRAPPPEIEEDALALLQDPLELTQRALENFQYARMAVGVDKAADGNATLHIELEGRNPDLLEGHPFRFNINLTGNLNPVLTALEQGLDLSQDLLDRTWNISR